MSKPTLDGKIQHALIRFSSPLISCSHSLFLRQSVINVHASDVNKELYIYIYICMYVCIASCLEANLEELVMLEE